LNLSELIIQKIEQQGTLKSIVADRTGLKYDNFLYRLNKDSLTAYDLLKVAKVLNIDLEQLKNQI
jgi:hypothetical protein